MFFNEDGDVISSADGECISGFDNFNVFDNTKVHDIIKVEKKVASKGLLMTNNSSLCDTS